MQECVKPSIVKQIVMNGLEKFSHFDLPSQKTTGIVQTSSGT